MSELNIDTLSSEELRAQADALEITYTDKTRDRDLKARILTALGDDEPAAETAGAHAQHTAPGEKLYKVTVHAKDDESGILPVAVNGITFPFPRGEEVTVKARYVHALKNCVKQKYNKKTERYEEVQAHLFTAIPA